jgi:hypothetical protein
MFSASLRLSAVGAVVTAVIASGGGLASESPKQIIAAAQAAVVGVQTVHVAGTISSGGTRITLDLDLANGKGGKGSMSENGLSFKIVELGKKVYISAGTAFWNHFGGKAVARLLAGKWLVAPATTGPLSSFASLTNVRTLFSGMLSSHGALAKAGTSTIDGEQVIAVKDTTQGGTLYVAATGAPYPIAIVKSGTDSGRVDFSRFNAPVAITAPAHAIELSQFN